jgi:hypothetical protein
MSNSKPRAGTVLRGDGNAALVVAPGASVLDALHELLDIEYGWGGEPPPPDHPLLLAAIDEHGLRITHWRSFTKTMCEAEGVEVEPGGDWWGPHGDGKREILVLDFEGDLYGLGEAVTESWALTRVDPEPNVG